MLKIFVAKDIQDSEPCGAGYGIAAEGAEKLHAIVEGGRDFGSGDDGSERESVADRLSQDEDIGNYALGFETPEMRAQAAKTDLHFIGNAHRTGGAHLFVHFS